MAKARAILKRRKSLRNIRKITKTMQMIATAKFQKSLKRAVGTKPFTQKVRELVREIASSIDNVDHPLLRRPDATTQTNRIAVLILTSNRGLAGAYNGNILRTANVFVREQQAAGKTVDLYVAGKKGVTSFSFQKKPITQKIEALDIPQYGKVEELANELMHRFTKGEIDSVSVVYMNFISTGVQKPDVMTLLPLAGIQETADHLGQQVAEKEHQARAGIADSRRTGEDVKHEEIVHGTTTYDFSPDARTLLDDILPVAVRTALFQTFLDATTSEHVARMVAMKSATDNAEKMGKLLAMQYNRARQSQITTELMEIMGGVEAMK